MLVPGWRGQCEQERAGKKGTPKNRGGDEKSTERNQARHDVCSTRRCQRAAVDTSCRAFTLFRPAREMGCGSHRVGDTRPHAPAMVWHVLWSERWHHVTQEIEDRTGLASSPQPFQCCELLGQHSRFWKPSRPHPEAGLAPRRRGLMIPALSIGFHPLRTADRYGQHNRPACAPQPESDSVAHPAPHGHGVTHSAAISSPGFPRPGSRQTRYPSSGHSRHTLLTFP